VAYLPPETLAYTDDVPLRRLGPPLETEGDRPPPADLESLVHVNGVGRLAGHAGNRLHFTETHEPWNWPAVYDLTLPLTIKNLGALDNLVFATTEGRPFVIDANTQGLDTPRKVQDCDMAYPDVAQGCYPHQAVVTPFGLVYATTDGLALLKPGATVDIITAPWFSTSEWRKLRPETIRLAWWRGFLLAATEAETFMLEIDGQTYGDAKAGALTTLTLRPTDWLTTDTGVMLYLENQTVYQWDAGDGRLPYLWVSRALDRGFKWSPAAGQARTGGTEFQLWDDKQNLFSRFVGDEAPFRLPRLARRRVWRVGFQGTEPVESARLSSTMSEGGEK
jgi:hypothetical protein